MTNTSPTPGPAEPALAAIDLALAAARAYDRPDIVGRLEASRARVAEPEVRVLIVGEFKQGKSTLLNALVNASICPVDDDVATSAPTLVRFGDPARAAVAREPTGGDDDTPEVNEIPVAELPLYTSETGNPGNERRVRLVQVEIPRRLLAGGLALVDTPGVGGLGSVHSAVTMATLPMADALLFVTDAGQELSEPELGFLRQAVELCPNMLGVLTKIDFYPQWRTILEIDQRRLAKAGIEMDFLPVSSQLRRLALDADDKDLNAESGFPDLVTYLRTDVLGQGRQIVARAAANDIRSVGDQLEAMFAAEREALRNPENVQALVRDLEIVRTRADALRGQAARWQVTLNDGIADLNADVDHDFRQRVRAILREADDAIDSSDPKDIWEEFEPWLYQRVAHDAAVSFTVTSQRVSELAEQVADHFSEAKGGEAVDIDVQAPLETLQRIGVDAHIEIAKTDGVFASGMIAMRGGYGGVLMFGMLGSLAGLAMLNPLTIGVGLVMGRKTLKDDRERKLTMRRQQGKQAARKYVDEVQFEVGKDLRDTLRRIQRALRDGFQARADELQRTTADAVAQAQDAAKKTETQRQDRLRDVETEIGRIRALHKRADALDRAAAQPEGAGR